MSELARPVDQHDHRQGPDGAPITLVEYGDYECPHCGAAHTVVQAIRAEMGDALRFAYRNFPLEDVHPHALHAAWAAEAAGLQGAFWEMHDMLFQHQRTLDDESLIGFAEVLDLDTEQFVLDMESAGVAERIREDFSSGLRSGVSGTPTFFINGRRHDGAVDAETLQAALRGRESYAPR
jgi:protein-disulfide isomerase